MALDKPYKDVPGTTVFDAEMARKGYHLNQFCMSLMKAANSEKFKVGERAYVDAWPMTEEQKACTRDRARLPGEFVARAGERRVAVRGVPAGLTTAVHLGCRRLPGISFPDLHRLFGPETIRR